jgi:transcriptional regulator with XRE-family HTH domain
MKNLLQAFRTECGWSQEALAAALKVSPKTISRWERAGVPQLNPFLLMTWSTVSRYSAHMYKYASTMVPQALIDDVRRDARERSLLVGPEVIVLAMSQQSRENWGIFRYSEGLSISALLDNGMKKAIAEWYGRIRDLQLADNSDAVVNMVSEKAPLGSKPPLWRRHEMRRVYPSIFDLVSYRITEEEYARAEAKIWIS